MSITSIPIPEILPNDRQLECINTHNGPVMVLAGPGTGKTTTVIKRIQKMLESGIDADSILALTFSEAAANEMKMRLLKAVGSKASSVSIHTYHAFCADIIAQNSLKFELIEDFSILDNLNKHRIMKEAVNEYRPRHLVTKRSDAYYYIPHLLAAVHNIKLNRITKDKYFEILNNSLEWKTGFLSLKDELKIQEELDKKGKRNRLKTTLKEIESLDNKIKKATETWDIYEKYSQKLLQQGFIDFDDMINLVLDAFDNDPMFLEEVRSNYTYILVDEYQDTNHSQNELIFKLASDNKEANIFAVGDDDQIIYTFQGAQVDNLERFLNKYPTAKVICLNENNRSTQTVLDFSYNLINQDNNRIETKETFSKFNISKRLIAKNRSIAEKDSLVQLHSFNDSIQENNYILSRIQSIIKYVPEMPLNEIAILTRTNNELEYFADQLKAKNIPFQINKQKDIFTLKPSLLVYFYLKALEDHNMNSMGLFGLVAHQPFSFKATDYTFLVRENRRVYNDFITIIKNNLSKHSWKDKEKIEKFITDYDYLKSIINDEKLSNIIIHLINRTGILQYYASKDVNRFENISSLKKLIDEANHFEKNVRPATFSMFLDYLDDSIKENINLEINDNSFIENAVQLLTVHRSKGREFSYLFLPNLLAKNWEKRRSTDSLKLPIEKAEFSKESEALRLLFVACTRAKHSLTLSYSTIIGGKSTELSTFIQSLTDNNELLETFNHELNSEEYVDEIIKQYTRLELYNKSTFMDELKLRAKNHIMSPSSMYLYNACPKQFLYAYLYRIPVIDEVNKNFSFGTSVHKALEKFIKLAIQKQKYSTKETLIKYFNSAIDKETFSSIQERDSSRQYGIKVLDRYFNKLTRPKVSCYKSVELNLDLIPLEKQFIKGKIDLVMLDDNKDYVLIDYKTGNLATTKNQVIAENGSHNHYLDQVKFYKLLFETKYPDIIARQGVIEFVEAFERSIYLDLTSEDNQNIKEKILNTFEKINNLEFTGVDEINQLEKACERCNYKLLCRLQTI